jgi:hypothetical protein
MRSVRLIQCNGFHEELCNMLDVVPTSTAALDWHSIDHATHAGKARRRAERSLLNLVASLRSI